MKKERFLDDDVDTFAASPPTRLELEEAFRQISEHMTAIKAALNTQALLIGGITKMMILKGICTKDELDDYMKEICKSMEQVSGKVN